MEPKVIQLGDKMFVGFKETHLFNQVGDRIGEQFARFSEHSPEIQNAVDPTVCWCVAADRAEDFDYLISLEVSKATEVPEGMVCERVPGRTYAVFTHRGDVANIGTTYDFIYKTWLPQSPYQRDQEAVFFERYDQRAANPHIPESEMEIYIPLQDKE